MSSSRAEPGDDDTGKPRKVPLSLVAVHRAELGGAPLSDPIAGAIR
ncbi:hypothetical protein [Streptantibioticus ferralitis]|uniref:Uncharacterized protein n=1 Tax=Streptantibioticus ferralitis TaxID=236510 RepID=A0ABT5Z1K6_9ACTN|nr:hypothetical protein [Streptantibioticus ferralitis]MDF2257574.1 hypothetical protein [Streptantibioticus ferralitis]